MTQFSVKWPEKGWLAIKQNNPPTEQRCVIADGKGWPVRVKKSALTVGRDDENDGYASKKTSGARKEHRDMDSWLISTWFFLFCFLLSLVFFFFLEKVWSFVKANF